MNVLSAHFGWVETHHCEVEKMLLVHFMVQNFSWNVFGMKRFLVRSEEVNGDEKRLKKNRVSVM